MEFGEWKYNFNVLIRYIVLLNLLLQLAQQKLPLPCSPCHKISYWIPYRCMFDAIKPWKRNTEDGRDFYCRIKPKTYRYGHLFTWMWRLNSMWRIPRTNKKLKTYCRHFYRSESEEDQNQFIFLATAIEKKSWRTATATAIKK